MLPSVVQQRVADGEYVLPAFKCTGPDCVRHFESVEGYFDLSADGGLQRDMTAPHCTNDDAPMAVLPGKGQTYFYVCYVCGDATEYPQKSHLK